MSTSKIAELARQAHLASNAELKAFYLVQLQKLTGDELREQVDKLSRTTTWAYIGRLLGMPGPTVYRQWKSKGPISVLRPTHKEPKE